MRIHASSKGNRGSTLLPCLCIAIVAGYALTAYLSASLQQYSSVVRSEYWNRAITVSEAGIEDGLQLINKYSGDWTPLDSWNNWSSLDADGWTTYSNNCYHVQRNIGNDAYDVFVINSADGNPTVISTATIAFPYRFSSTINFAAVGVGDPAPRTVKRQVEVQTVKSPLFDVALAGLDGINLNGKTIRSDSFDSSDYVTFPNGLYVAAKARSEGDIVTDGNIINMSGAGSATINGKIKTGPNGSISIGYSGRVGEKSWTDTHTGIQPGWSANDMNVKLPEVKPPADWTSLGSGYNPGSYNGKFYNYVFADSDSYRSYKVSNLTGSILVRSTAKKVRLYITDNYIQTGNDVICVNWTSYNGSGNVEICAGGFFKLNGGGLINVTSNAANFAVYGTPGCTSVEINQNASFAGLIYAPQADFKVGGGDNQGYDFVGSVVAKSITLNGNFNFHYDENLRNVNASSGRPARGYVPTQWLETKAE